MQLENKRDENYDYLQSGSVAKCCSIIETSTQYTCRNHNMLLPVSALFKYVEHGAIVFKMNAGGVLKLYKQ